MMFMSFMLSLVISLPKVRLGNNNREVDKTSKIHPEENKLLIQLFQPVEESPCLITYLLYVCFSGYFIYDFMDICRNIPPGDMWEVLLHHVAVSKL